MAATARHSTARTNSDSAGSRRIRIAHCIHSLELGGAQQVVKYLVTRGDTESFEHRIFTGKSGEMHSEIANAGVRIDVIKRYLPKIDPLWALRLMNALRNERIDVLHTHLFGDSLHGVAAAVLLGAPPVVVTLHNSMHDFSSLQRKGYRWLLPRAAAAVACAPAAGESFREFLAGSGVDVETIANGMDPDAVRVPTIDDRTNARAALGVPASALVVGALGRLVDQKGFDVLIEAFCQVTKMSEHDLRLVIVGDGTKRDALRRQGEDAGLADRLVLTGFRADARQLLAGFDVLAFSSRYEGLPMALLEGMASRCCVVATPVPGLAEIITQDVDGLLSESRDPTAFAQVLGRALGDAGLRQRLGDEAYRTFHTRYTVDRMVNRYEDLYRRVLSGRKLGQKETRLTS
jgi:glycosyltransferase involved in cell wall biosynthesis